MAETTTPELVSPYIPVTVSDDLENPTDIAALLQRQEDQIAALTATWDSISQAQHNEVMAKLNSIATEVTAAKTAATNANSNASGAKTAVATLQSKVQTMNNTNLKNIGRSMATTPSYPGGSLKESSWGGAAGSGTLTYSGI